MFPTMPTSDFQGTLPGRSGSPGVGRREADGQKALQGRRTGVEKRTRALWSGPRELLESLVGPVFSGAKVGDRMAG